MLTISHDRLVRPSLDKGSKARVSHVWDIKVCKDLRTGPGASCAPGGFLTCIRNPVFSVRVWRAEVSQRPWWGVGWHPPASWGWSWVWTPLGQGDGDLGPRGLLGSVLPAGTLGWLSSWVNHRHKALLPPVTSPYPKPGEQAQLMNLADYKTLPKPDIQVNTKSTWEA